jgi:hypothetical protein
LAGPRGFPRTRAQVGTLALAAEKAEKLDGLPFGGGAEPMRDPRIELGGLAGAKGQVMIAEAQPEAAVEHINPLVALVGLQVVRVTAVPATAVGRDDELVGLDTARALGQRDHRHAVPRDRAQVDARVTGGRGVDELVQRDAVRPGERKQQLKSGLAVAGLKPGQRADRDAGLRGQVGKGDLALAAQRPQPRSDDRQRLIQVIAHAR